VNSKGIVKNKIENNRRRMYQVEFDNGLIATIDDIDLIFTIYEV
jgi:hypothetical protein